jgi:hypothetical protein
MFPKEERVEDTRTNEEFKAVIRKNVEEDKPILDALGRK